MLKVLDVGVRSCRWTSKAKAGGRRRYDHGKLKLNVYRKDREGLVHTLAAYPDNLVRFALAIRAFNIELAQVPDSARGEVNVAQMRYKFWKESIDLILKGRPRMQPTLLELSFTVDKCSLTSELFYQMIESRVKLLDRRSTASIDDYAEVLSGVYGSMYQLLYEIYGTKCDDASKNLISSFGRAQGLVNSVRGIRFLAGRHTCAIPLPILQQYDLAESDIFHGRVDDRVAVLVKDLAEAASREINLVNSSVNASDKYLRLTLLPRIPINWYLERLQSNKYNVFSDNVAKRELLLPLVYKWNAFKIGIR